MSDDGKQLSASVSKLAASGYKSRTIHKVVTATRQVEGGGFVVRRPLGGSTLEYCDPFLMLDHGGPVTYGPGEAVGAPDHPHRGFETVSYVLQGEFQHEDSKGHKGKLGPYDVQWMTAGSGIVHSEMPGDDIMENGGTVEAFQLWVNLPKKEKMCKPRYQDVSASKMPVVTSEDGHTSVRVIAGESLGQKAVIDTKTPIMYLDIRVNNRAEFVQEIPDNYNGFLYVFRGEGEFGPESNSQAAKEGQLLQLSNKAGDSIRIRSTTKKELAVLLIAGVPLNDPVARYGPFVMNTMDEIQKAFQDYQSGKMGGITGMAERVRKTKEALKKSKGPRF